MKHGKPRPSTHRAARSGCSATARRKLVIEARNAQQRFRYAFIHTYKPILDDAPFRAFATLVEYRAWCNQNLPSWLGYGTEEV
jgi:hypothetical protein